MISDVYKFEVDSNYILDLRDDFIMNGSLELYDFIGDDPIRAFHLGRYVSQWFNELSPQQKYLHSKLLRHNKDDLDRYTSQIQYWMKDFPDDEELNLQEVAEFIINNMFWDEGFEEIDRIKLALFFGMQCPVKEETNE